MISLGHRKKYIEYNFSTLGGVDFNENDNHIGQKIIRAKCFNETY